MNFAPVRSRSLHRERPAIVVAGRVHQEVSLPLACDPAASAPVPAHASVSWSFRRVGGDLVFSQEP
jgi:hypothetical protein